MIIQQPPHTPSILALHPESIILHDNLTINLQIRSPNAPTVRPPISIICVLDISGSMDTEASQGGGVESDGFTRLDLVKHSVNTIIHSLGDGDALGIVTFSDVARVDFDIVEMGHGNREKALEMIAKMKTQGSTNLWDGIRLGLQLSKHEKCKQRNTFVVVLSDGQPNQSPPDGQLATTIQYVKDHPLTASMSMFGYGYNLDTKLLSALTEVGGGCFGYIPDCSMIGTIFVNFLSMAFSSFSAKLQASIELKNGQIKQFNGSGKNYTNLGAIQYGVTRNILIKFNGVLQQQQIAQISVYFVQNSRQKITLTLKNKVQGNQQNVKIQNLKNDHVNLLQYCLENAQTNLQACVHKANQHLDVLKQVKSGLMNESPFLDAMIRDLQSENKNQGQVLIALSKPQYWFKWGRHYFPALKIAHTTQICTNFKDPSLQLYGGQQFQANQSKIDTIFISLPPPIPSIQKYDSNGNLKVVADMSNYYDEEGGCIHGDCLVRMADGTKRKVKDIKKGDIVMGMGGPVVIKCVVKTQVNKTIQLIKFPSGLIITKYHPIHLSNTWQFPIQTTKTALNSSKSIKLHTEAYYNFILEEGTSIIVNNIPCIVLGHGIEEDQVAKHEYFGGEKIIRDVTSMKGWTDGCVIMGKGKAEFKRDGISKKVVGIDFF